MKNQENQLKINIAFLLVLFLSLFCCGCTTKTRMICHIEHDIVAEPVDAISYYKLGEYYYFISSDFKIREKASEAFMNSALMGNKDAQCVLGYMYYNGDGVSKDIDESRDWLEIAEKNGSSLASKLKSIYFGK